jgi:hypothetical protein
MYGSNLSRQLLSNLKILSRDSELGIFLPLTIGLPRAIFMVVRVCPLWLAKNCSGGHNVYENTVC